ncbi:MAG: hypothetical protein ACKVH8_13930 [Pirellulales bacterium]
MACGHTDDVPNTVDPEAWPTPESSSLPPNLEVHSPKPTSWLPRILFISAPYLVH